MNRMICSFAIHPEGHHHSLMSGCRVVSQAGLPLEMRGFVVLVCLGSVLSVDPKDQLKPSLLRK